MVSSILIYYVVMSCVLLFFDLIRFLTEGETFLEDIWDELYHLPVWAILLVILFFPLLLLELVLWLLYKPLYKFFTYQPFQKK